MRRGIVALVICMILVAGCGDPGVEMHFENPCDQPVEFIFQLVDRGTATPFGAANALTVAAHGTGVLAPLVIDFDDGTEALITIVGLPDYEERWGEPVSRTFTFDPSLCGEIVNTATEP